MSDIKGKVGDILVFTSSAHFSGGVDGHVYRGEKIKTITPTGIMVTSSYRVRQDMAAIGRTRGKVGFVGGAPAIPTVSFLTDALKERIARQTAILSMKQIDAIRLPTEDLNKILAIVQAADPYEPPQNG